MSITFDPNLTALPGETAFQWARRTGMYSQARICTCCMIIEANGESCGEGDECFTCKPGGGYELFYQANPNTHVSLGAFTDECGHDWQDDTQAEAHMEGCERFGFCQSSCDLCGDHHHGDRYAATFMPRAIPTEYTIEGKSSNEH